jgi:hypothetical protein
VKAVGDAVEVRRDVGFEIRSLKPWFCKIFRSLSCQRQ